LLRKAKELIYFYHILQKNPDEVLGTTMFNYLKWPKNSCPASESEMIQLLALIENSQGEAPDSPIVVICRWVCVTCKITQILFYILLFYCRE